MPDIPLDASDLETWLTDREAAFSDIRPGLAKEIIWSEVKEKTPLSVVYVHGFSASKGEVRPLPDLVARALGANLFYTRLAGHGRSGQAMAEATVADWQADMAEALAIGALLGERMVVIATSTGAPLCADAILSPTVNSERVAGVVFLSPNFGIKAKAARLLTGPFSRLLARLIIGKERAFEPRNDLHAAYWTNSYPVEALLPMAALVKRVAAIAFEKASVPALFIASPRDTVVDPKRTADVARRWGGPVTMIDPGEIGDIDFHLPAGDALSPGSTQRLAAELIKWIRNNR
ncbi:MULTISPECIES: alpha/beta fold hydrolase [unclassified Rhizobium]|uniref:alpha/beta hydrolase n=1 Tax=unclassified Rhizobium TaxID=2613769 RepID=UPI0006FA43D9|nr:MULTISPECIES: alpha/beta fold hydrolase [unclassified Rhizobium]KQV34317.1 lysophospholipase [Rhizobium sp. Root1212]KRD23695.1 lysophospholipase [Rhizobium sp. Root268]